MDGGLSDSIPYQHALSQGNDRAIVILTRPHSYQKEELKHKWIYRFLYRKTPKLAEAIINRPADYNQSLNNLAELEEKGKVFVIRPPQTIAVSRLENDPNKTAKVFEEAQKHAEQIMPKLKEWLKLNNSAQA